MVTIHTKKNCKNQNLQLIAHNILNAANEGSLLHQLYLDELIDEPLFQAGLAFSRLQSRAMRSSGINNRVRTASQSWGRLQGKTYDKFSNEKIEDTPYRLGFYNLDIAVAKKTLH